MINKKLLKISSIFTLCLLLFSFFAGPVSAAYFKTDEKIKEPIEDDVYTISPSFTSSFKVLGDLVAIGGNVLVENDVKEDSNLIGGNLNILGKIGDDLRMIGGNLTVGNDIGDDLFSMGGTVKILPGVSVKGDAVLAGGEIVSSGEIEEDLIVKGGSVNLNSKVKGDVKVNADELKVGEDFSVKGDLNYQAPNKVEIEENKVGGNIVYHKAETEIGKEEGILFGTLAFLGISFISFIKFLSLLVASIIFILLFSKLSKKIVKESQSSFWRRVLLGLALLVCIPVVSLFLLFTIVGIVPSALLGGSYFVLLVLSSTVAGIIIGGMFSSWFGKGKINWKWTILGVLVFCLLGFIPILGWIAKLLIILLSLGTLGYLFYSKLWRAIK